MGWRLVIELDTGENLITDGAKKHGAYNKWFSFNFREANSEHYKYEDVLPNSHKITVTGLKINTLYLFSVMATNALGSSKYLPDLLKAQTKGKKLWNSKTKK